MSDKAIDRTSELAQYGPDLLVQYGKTDRPPTKEECEKVGATFIDWDDSE